MNDVHYKSTNNDWCTPKNILTLVRKVAAIGLDPCSNAESIVDAKKNFKGPPNHANGLTQSWVGHGLVFVNPPYGRAIGDWMAKCKEEARQGAEIIALIPARTDTTYWHDYVTTADQVCFWRGRVKFKGAPSSAPFPSAIVHWGDLLFEFRQAFGEYGWIV